MISIGFGTRRLIRIKLSGYRIRSGYHIPQNAGYHIPRPSLLGICHTARHKISPLCRYSLLQLKLRRDREEFGVVVVAMAGEGGWLGVGDDDGTASYGERGEGMEKGRSGEGGRAVVV